MLKFFTSDLRRNIIKILCLSIGLFIGFLLVSRVYFDKTYDSFFKDADRIYMIYETVERDGEFSIHPTASGGYAPLFAKDFPQVEIGTRFRTLGPDVPFELEDGRKLVMPDFCVTDENLFEVFDIPVTGGDPKNILMTDGACIIPRSFAVKIGGDVINTTFTVPAISDDMKFTIAGVYDDLPLNSSLPNAFYFGMSSCPEYTDGRDLLVGNDIYHCYIKLLPGVSPADLTPGIQKIVEENIPKGFQESFHLNIVLDKLTHFYASQKDVNTMDWMLSLLATILLCSSGLNFLLIVVGQVGKRSKEMAVRKCYGTSDLRIFGRVMTESLFYLVVSVIIGTLTIFCFPELCSRLLGYTPGQLFATRYVWLVILGVCLVLLVLTGVIPAWIYCRTPVASAFRGSLKNRRGWKMALLSIQFFSSSVLMCLLVLIGRQYKMIMDFDKGFNDKNVAWVYLSGSKYAQRDQLVSELQNLSFVKDVATALELIGEGCSGNNVWMDGNTDNMFNVADNYNVNHNFFEMMGIDFIQGETFSAQTDSTVNQVVVEKSFIDVVKKLTGDEDDYIIGKSFQITEHGSAYYTICGVINDIRRGEITSTDTRPGVWFPSQRSHKHLYVKLDEITPQKMELLQETIDKTFPTQENFITPLKGELDAKMAPIQNFAISVMIAGIAILFISIIGLIGYTGDEVQRRAKEIAIRKVTGTSARQIISLFVRNIITIAVPSLVLGGAVAMIAGRKWISQFSYQVSLSPFSMILCIIVLLLLITGIVALNTRNIASSNPVEHLRNE